MTTKLFVCATYDMKAQIFSLPFCSQNEQTALRSFSSEVMNPESGLFLYVDDYQLFALGEYDQTTGHYDLLPTPELLISGSQITNLKRQMDPVIPSQLPE